MTIAQKNVTFFLRAVITDVACVYISVFLSLCTPHLVKLFSSPPKRPNRRTSQKNYSIQSKTTIPPKFFFILPPLTNNMVPTTTTITTSTPSEHLPTDRSRDRAPDETAPLVNMGRGYRFRCCRCAREVVDAHYCPGCGHLMCGRCT